LLGFRRRKRGEAAVVIRTPEFQQRCSEDGQLPGYPAGPIGVHRHAVQHVELPTLSVSAFVVILILAAICAVIVSLPVLGDKLFTTVTPRAAKATPITFLLGLAALVSGVISRVWFLDVVGACLIGGVLLGAILVNY
jgi:hypothetical protein